MSKRSDLFREALAVDAALRNRIRELEAALRHAVYRDHKASTGCSACEDIDRLLGVTT